MMFSVRHNLTWRKQVTLYAIDAVSTVSIINQLLLDNLNFIMSTGMETVQDNKYFSVRNLMLK
jgi:hypothetical protein